MSEPVSEPSISYRDNRDGERLNITLHEPDARVQNVPEAVIQDIWQHLRFDRAALTTTADVPVEVYHPGTLNTDAGPDFTNARIRLDDLSWMGDVEIHRTSGEWIEHRHDEDPRYDRVVLHVTLVADRHTGALRRSDGTVLPEVVLYPRLQHSLRALLHRFYATPTPDFFCAAHWPHVPDDVRRPLVRALGRERIEQRRAGLAERYLATPDLDVLLYERVFRALGYSKNADALETLAGRVPLHRLRALTDLRDIEALLFGTAGLLPPPADFADADEATSRYTTDLRDRFKRLAAADPVRPMNATVWTRARLRASSLPVRRIAQAAALVAPGGPLRSDPVARFEQAVRSARPLAALRSLLTDVPLSTFWDTHLRLDRACKPGPAAIGQGHADAALINAALPLLYLHAEQTADLELEDLVLSLYARFPAASDSVIRQYKRHGFEPADALEAQGLHQLFRTRCSEGRCLSCAVGRFVLDGGTRDDHLDLPRRRS